jgi:hypothetical protein
MDEVKAGYDKAPGSNAGDFDAMLQSDLSDANALEAKELAEQGALDADRDLYFGVEGVGTDIKQIKGALKGKSRDEIKKIEAAYNEKNKPRTLWDDLGGDLSGREYTDVMADVIYGEPKTLEEKRTKLKFKADMDKSGLWDDVFGDALNVDGQLAELDAAIAAVEKAEASGDEDQIAMAKELAETMTVGVAAGIENSRVVADSVIDTTAQVGAAIVGIIVTIATMGGGAPAAAAAWSAMAASAAAGAAASAVTSMALKAALKGGNMSLEELGTDAAVGLVDVLTAVATAGLSKAILNSATMKGLVGPTAKKLVQTLTNAGAEAVENLLGSIPSAAAQQLMDPALWASSDPLMAIMKALGEAGAMGVVGGAVIGGGIGSAHGVYQKVKGLGGIKPPGLDPDVLVPKAKEHLKDAGIPVHEGAEPKVDGTPPKVDAGDVELKTGSKGDPDDFDIDVDGDVKTPKLDPAQTGGTPTKAPAGAGGAPPTRPPDVVTPADGGGGPPPKPLRQNLTDADLAAMGMPADSIKKFKEFADGYGLIIDVRPTNPEAMLKLQTGEALPKPEILKQKSINDLDVMLGIDPSHRGLVGHLDPANLKVPAEGATIKHPTTGEMVTVDAALAKELQDRHVLRSKEFSEHADKMKSLVEKGGFSIEPPGIIKFGEGPDAKPFTGDHDVFDFRRKDGKPLTPQEYDYLVQQMRFWGMNVEHGAHLHWDTADPSKLDIAKQHAPGGKEPLIRFGDGGSVKEAHWDGNLDAQKNLGPSSDTVTPGGKFAEGGEGAKKAGMKPSPADKLDPGAMAKPDPAAVEFLGPAATDFNASLADGTFHGSNSQLLEGLIKTNGVLLSAADLEAQGIVRRTGEGDSFSGKAQPKKFISVGAAEAGFGTGLAYARGSERLAHYNVQLYGYAELVAEIAKLDKALASGMDLGNIGLASREHVASRQAQLAKELERRNKLPAGHPSREGGAGAGDDYPILFEFDGGGLKTKHRGDVKPGGPLGGEASVYDPIDLKERLKRVYVPANRVDEVAEKLKGVLGHDRFQVLPLPNDAAIPTGHAKGSYEETAKLLDRLTSEWDSLIKMMAGG